MAHTGKKLFALLFWVIIVSSIGILIFCKGFLLKRVVVERNSTCKTDFTHTDKTKHGKDGCWMHPRFKRAVVIVIDALRYDFVRESTLQGVKEPYENKLTAITSALANDPTKSLLYKFIADPPTTTRQRINGLTTGSLPTFVEASTNFGGEAITEDNIIDQLKTNNKKITFMGDDTWKDVFPLRFDKSYWYPSLNVKDLHTVDNGIMEHLLPEMKSSNWDVLIAHFLGVDHCGHTFGPQHSAMEDKLNQMNEMLRKVMAKLEDDTLLVVLGDHGMTKTGDHGGDSQDEIEAALFMYSKQQLTANTQIESETVLQIDLVPTLSLLLGVPIPFSNLGMVIPDLFSYCPWWKDDLTPTKQMYHKVKALHLNAHQVHQYLETYGQMSAEFPEAKYTQLEWLFKETEKQLQELVTDLYHNQNIDGYDRFRDLRDKYVKYLKGARAMCQDIWAKFDLGAMVLGIATLMKSTFFGLFLYNNVENKAELTPSVLAALTSSIWAVFLFAFLSILGLKLAGMIAALVVGISTIALFAVILYRIVSGNTKSHSSTVVTRKSFRNLFFFSIFALMLYIISFYSNSFVVFENKTTHFLLQSLTWSLFIAVLINTPHKNHSSKKFDLGRVLTSPRFILFVLTIMFSLCVRLTVYFHACREEQTSPKWTCEATSFVQSLAALTQGPFKNMRYFFSLSMVCLFIFGVQYWQRRQGNLNGDAPSILCIRYFLPIMAACFVLSWALQAAPIKWLERLPSWQITLLPRVAYLFCFISIILLWIRPLCLFLVKRRDDDEVMPTSSTENLVTNVYSHMKFNWKTYMGKSKGEKKKPLAYGLATVFSASLVVYVTAVGLLCMMLLQDGLAPVVTLLIVALFFFLELFAAYCRLQPGYRDNYDVPFHSIVTISLLSSYFFFATGHQATISNIHWHAAFVGFHGDPFFYAIPASLVTIETFSGTILCCVALPLLLFWPRTRGTMAYTYEKIKTDDQDRGELVLNEDYVGLRVSLFRLVLGMIVISAIKILALMGCALLHRRHLMVWKIFAPRFVYEGASFFIVCAVCSIVYCFVLRIDKAVDNWIKQIDDAS